MIHPSQLREVNAPSKACYYQIRNVRHIMRHNTLDACNKN